MKFFILCFFVGVFFANSQVLLGIDSEPLIINIVGERNGVGWNQDIDILITVLTDLGHDVRFVKRDLSKEEKIEVRKIIKSQNYVADINIFIEHVNKLLCYTAKKNYLLPNAEWLKLPPDQVARFDCVLCRTKEAVRIFKPLNPNAVFMGFTCIDRFDPSVVKDYQVPLHLAGASVQKGTETLISAWTRHSEFPFLQLVRHMGSEVVPQEANINLIYEYLLKEELITLQNHCGLHICPSITEGFGYYIVEGLSTEAVVVATDAPPMNEFVLDKRCLVRYNRTKQWSEPYDYATGYYVDEQDLEAVVANLLSLPEDELKEIGRKNRELFLQKDKEFRENIAKIFTREQVFP